MAEAYGGDIPYVPDDVTIGQFVLDLPHQTRPAWCYDSRPWLIEEDTGREIRLDEVMLPAAAAQWSVPELIVQAEKLLATIPFDQLPARASGVVIDLGDLVGESRHG